MQEHTFRNKLESQQNLRADFSEEEKLFKVKLNGKEILEYVYGEKDDPNPSFRLVKTAGGQTLSLYRPWDHPWHPGMFFSWKYINGHNFWEAKYHGENNTIVTDSFTPMENDIGFDQTLSYITYEGEKVLKEDRSVWLEEEEDGYLIHWEGNFSSVKDHVILSSSENTEKTPWGGYGGLTCRLNRNFLGPVITTDLGTYTAEEAFSKPFKWCDYSGKLDGYIEEQWAGICIMDHPMNIRYPSPKLTYDYKDMQLLTSALLFNSPYKLTEKEPLDLQFTFYIHDDKANKERLCNIWNKLRSI